MSSILTLPTSMTATATTSARRSAWRAGVARLAGACAAMCRPRGSFMDSTRLSQATLRDIGLLPEQSPDEPIWGQGGIMWRP